VNKPVCSGRRACRGVLDGPLKRVVGNLLSAFGPDDAVVRASFELLVVGYGLCVAVVLDVRVVDRGGA
jgi:hypothetical protein